MDRILFLDTETTDLLSPVVARIDNQPYVVEVGIVALNKGSNKIEHVYDELVRLPMNISMPEEATKISGITDKELKENGITKDEMIEDVTDILKDCDMLVAHNASFDVQVMENEANREGKKFPWPERIICTVEETEYFKSHRLSLGDLYEACLGEKPKGKRHRALDDAKFTAEIYIKLVEKGIL